MRQRPLSSHGEVPATEEQNVRDLNEAGTYPTPGQVLWEIGCLIAACLGLGVLANLLFGPPHL